ncbi:hypothetical protein Tco_0058224 [Tanacetum coccineum]
MPTEMELTLEQTQQGVSYEVSVLSDIEDSHGPSDAMHNPLPATQSQKDFVSKLTEIHSFLLTFSLRVFTMKMEILLEPTSNKLMVAGNPVKKILLKLNLSDHKSILTDLKVTRTKPGRMTKPYSSPRFIANCFIARNLKKVVKEDNPEQQMSHESDDDMEYDPSNIYWARGDDEVELTDEESSNSKDEDEVAKNFRIETNVFDFETPLCRAFKEFNYLLQIDPDLLIEDIEGFKTYKDYKDDWIYEWNKDMQWVHEKPWTDNGAWEEPALVEHYCAPFNYKNGCSEWPTLA